MDIIDIFTNNKRPFYEMFSSRYFDQILVMIQLLFLTNGFSLIDITHRLHRLISTSIHNYKQRDSKIKTKYHDEYQFDLGYHQSYSLVIFLNCFLYSFEVPLVSLFATLFFYGKYLIDKYNLIFVYYKTYDSGGKFRKTVTNLMFIILIIYLFSTIFYFASKFNNHLHSIIAIGSVFSITWLVLFVIKRNQLEK